MARLYDRGDGYDDLTIDIIGSTFGIDVISAEVYNANFGLTTYWYATQSGTGSGTLRATIPNSDDSESQVNGAIIKVEAQGGFLGIESSFSGPFELFNTYP